MCKSINEGRGAYTLYGDILGSVVIVKFITNTNQGNRNRFITRTLKKIGVLHNSNEVEIKDGELWRVLIKDEVCKGQAKGCFILNPLEKIDPLTLVKLVPGMYTEIVKDKVLFILPKSADCNCILPLDVKRKLNHRAVLVCLSNRSVQSTPPQ